MMTEQITIKGYWWLPITPDNTVAGVLTYTPEESIKLELIGQLKPNISALEEYIERTDEEVIFGISSDAKEISLMRCHTSGGSLNFSCPFPIQRYNCQHLIMGAHISSLDAPHFFKTQINIPFLSLWATPNAISNKLHFHDKYIEEYQISFKTGDNNIVKLDIEDYKFSIDGFVNYNGYYFEPRIVQKTYLTITREVDYSLHDILKKIFLFEQFISLAIFKPVESSKITIFDKTKFQLLSNGEKHYLPMEYIRVFCGKNWFEQEKNLHERNNFLFAYDTIKSEFTSILTKWYSEQDDIAPIRHHLIECVRKKHTFSSVDFLTIIQAIEGFWWRFRDVEYKRLKGITQKSQTNLKTILEELILEYKDVSQLNLCEINVDEVVDSRHYFSHFVPKEKKPHAKDGVELYYITQKIRKLLICCVLNFVGFSNNQIIEIVQKSNNSYLHD